MNPLTLKTLVAATLLVAAGGFAAGTVAYLADAPGDAGNHAQATFGGRVIDAWTGDVNANVTKGTLDFRTFEGVVHVVAWDRPAFEVTLLAPEDDANAQQLGDAEVKPAFTSAVAGNALHLALNVTREGTATVTYGTSLRLAVIAFVPDVEWVRVNACSGTAHAGLLTPVTEALGVSDDEDDAECITRDGAGTVTVNVGGVRVLNESYEPARWHVPFALVNLTGGDARLSAEYADLTLENAKFTTLTAVTPYGDVTATGALVRNFTAFTEYGNVRVQADRVTDVTVGTEYGDITLDTDFRGAARAKLATEYGDVRVTVPADGPRAYRVTAATEYGNLRIRLPGVTNADDAEDARGNATTRATALPALPTRASTPDAEDAREERVFTGETDGFDSFTDRFTLDLLTEYGNVRAAASGAGADAEA